MQYIYIFTAEVLKGLVYTDYLRYISRLRISNSCTDRWHMPDRLSL